jgi:riboflavin kinase/FMN adenylyltransferase
MHIIHAAAPAPASPRVCLAIGVFDGVHLGHQQVIRQMVTDAEQQEARPIVITFDRHPNAVVAPDRVPPLIYSLPQKLRAIADLSVDTTLLIHFDEAFSRHSGEQFIRGLARDFGHIHSICVGSAFTFGHRRSGNVDLLKKLGQELNFSVHGLAAVSLDGEVVSSTRIREAVRNGQLDLASQMLGRGYSLAGTVVRGDQLGRQLGFPTANIDTTGLILPPNGVYAVHVIIRSPSPPDSLNKSESPAIRCYRAVLNIGLRPTVASPTPQLRVEVHLLDFTNDIYGRELEITFIEKVRDEQKFPSLEALKEQIARDIESAKGRWPVLPRPCDGRSPA